MKRSKLLTKALNFALCVILSISCLFGGACGGEDNSGKTTITVYHYSGGVGDAWVDGAIERFEALYANESFEDGKTGVYVDWTNNETGSDIDDIETSGDNVYIVSTGGKLQRFIQSGYVLDISDVVTKAEMNYNSIENKLITKRDLQDDEGRYYALPHYEIYNGVSYDIDVFTDYNLFLADKPAEGKQYSDSGVYFVKNSSTKKSCGADGKYDTSDDGLPTTLEEFVVLCENMYSQGVVPFYYSGYQKNYTSYLSLGMWAALAGKDGMSVNFTLDGEIDKVTGVSENALFTAKDGSIIKEPVVQKGYQIMADTYKDVYDSVERYYSVAFTELAYKNKWIEYTSENTSHTDAIYTFMMNDKNPKYGMFIEGSYWYALAQKHEYDKAYKEAYPENEDRNVAWMPLPTALKKEDAVTENNGRAAAQLNFGSSYAFINANIANEKGKVDAAKALLEFLYTDEELSTFTKITGTAKALNYTLADKDYDAMSTYQKGVWDVRKQNSIIYQSSDSELFLNMSETFSLSNTNISVSPFFGATQYRGYVQAFTKEDTDSYEVFMNSSLTKS